MQHTVWLAHRNIGEVSLNISVAWEAMANKETEPGESVWRKVDKGYRVGGEFTGWLAG